MMVYLIHGVFSYTVPGVCWVGCRSTTVLPRIKAIKTIISRRLSMDMVKGIVYANFSKPCYKARAVFSKRNRKLEVGTRCLAAGEFEKQDIPNSIWHFGDYRATTGYTSIEKQIVRTGLKIHRAGEYSAGEYLVMVVLSMARVTTVACGCGLFL